MGGLQEQVVDRVKGAAADFKTGEGRRDVLYA
jgi:hypothetical protein